MFLDAHDRERLAVFVIDLLPAPDSGGFGRGTLGPWGEPAIKNFVQEAIQEALKLESALARLTSERSELWEKKNSIAVSRT